MHARATADRNAIRFSTDDRGSSPTGLLRFAVPLAFILGAGVWTLTVWKVIDVFGAS